MTSLTGEDFLTAKNINERIYPAEFECGYVITNKLISEFLDMFKINFENILFEVIFSIESTLAAERKLCIHMDDEFDLIV